VLRSDGILAPPVATETKYTFVVGKGEAGAGNEAKPSGGLYVLTPPSVLLMSTLALKTYYHDQSIYFWNADHSALVPDLRYLPVVVPGQRRATEVLGWLTGGPAEWLASTAVRLPDDTEKIGTVPQTGDRLEVNLSALPGPDEKAELDWLAAQLAWSLPGQHGELELKIRNQSRKIIQVDDFLKSNALYDQTADPQRFCVYAGAVHPVVDAGETAAPTPIAPELNRNVVSAALGRGGGGVGVLAALVTRASDGRLRLQTGTGTDLVSGLKPGPRTYASMSRPVWLKAGDPNRPIGLVVADGRLYRFRADDPRLSEVVLPNATGAVTSVSAALDGNRIAFIAGGGVYVAALTVDGGTGIENPVVTAGPARRLSISPRDPSALDWSDQNRMVVAGIDPDSNRTAIYEESVDGGLETMYDPDTGARVTQLSAYPTNPIRSTSERVMYEANKVSWSQQYSVFDKVSRERVAATPGVPISGETGNPTAPVFFY
jgi:hypothetical protein